MSIFNTGRGFKSNPYKIYTEDDLFELSSYSGIGTENVHYQLQNDITLTKNWNPLGTTTTPFKGVFDGNGFTISNVDVKGSVSRLGFFGMIESATVKSLNVDGITITATGGAQHGGFVGFANKSTINDVSIKNVNMTLATSTSFAGGFMGKAGNGANFTDTVFINNVSVENVTIRNGQDYLSGFIGDISSANISNSISLGDIYLYPSRTFAPSRNHSFGWVRSSSYLTLNGVIRSTEGRTVGALYGITSDTSVDAKISRVSNPRVLANYSGIWQFGGENPWDMIDGQLPKQTYFGTSLNPIPIASYSDIQTKMMNPDYKYGLSGAFKLVNDITIPRFTASGAWNILSYAVMADKVSAGNLPTFSGYFDGGGYALNDINHTTPSGDAEIYLFATLEEATIKNLSIVWSNLDGSSSNRSYYAGYYLLAKVSNNSNIENIRIIAEKGRNIKSVTALPAPFTDGNIYKNIFISFGNLINVRRASNIYVTQISNDVTQNAVLENVLVMFTRKPDYFPDFMINYNGSNFPITIKNIVSYAGGYTNSRTQNEYVSNVSNLNTFRSGTSYLLDSFRDSWIFDGVNDPIQKIFVKITEKIEERIIQSYSKISSILLNRFKGKTLISELFAQPIMSKVKRFKGFIQTLTSYSDKSTSETIRKKKSLKVNINFSKKMTIDLSRFKSRLSAIKNHSTKLVNNVTNIKKGKKSSNGYTEPLVSSSNTIKRLVKNVKSFIKKIDSKSNLYVIKKYLIKINSFGRKVISSANPSFLTRAYRTIVSYSSNMRSIVRKYSNIYKFGKAVVSNSVGKISNQSKRFTRIKKMAKSYSEKMFNSSKLFYKVASPVEVYAYITAKFNKITLFKRKNKTSINIKESKTIIKQKNSGGED